MKRIFFVIIVGLSLIGCKTDNKETLSAEIDHAVPLKGEIVSLRGQIFTEPLRMVYHNPYLIYYSAKEDQLIKYFDTERGVVTKRFCNKGKGPGELLSVGNMQTIGNDRVYIYDMGKKQFFSFNVANGTLMKLFTTEPIVSQVFIFPDRKLFFADGIFPDSRFRLYDYQGNIVEKIKRFPDFKDVDHTDTIFLNMGYQNMTSVSPDGQRVANIVYNGEIIEGYKFNRYNKLVADWRKEWSIVPFTPIGNENMQMVQHSLQSFGFRNIATNNELICCVYSKKSVKESIPRTASGDYLVLFNWKGSIKKVFQLNIPVRTIAITPDSKYVFGSTIIDDDIKIVKYEINGVRDDHS